MNFERGMGPKESLEIGGIDLQKKYDETVGEWKRFFHIFPGKIVKFHVDKKMYPNWESRVSAGELAEIRTLKVEEANDNFEGIRSHLFFRGGSRDSKCEKTGSSLVWFVDLSQKIYIIEEK